MLFTQLEYFALLGLTLLLFWSLPGRSARKWVLLVASLAFYSWWDWRLTGLLLTSTLVDYACALGIAVRPRHDPWRRRLLLCSIGANLGILGVFKYYDFFAGSVAEGLAAFGWRVEPTLLLVLLPPGISFYTFQSMAYTIDVYEGKAKARRSLLDIAVFVAFFPQLIAGPILRAREFLPQLDRLRSRREIAVSACLLLFVIGFWKKAVVADTIAVWVDPVFAQPRDYDAATQLLCLHLFLVQIYCDFSGYVDMALASAGLLGFHLPENFRAPLLARNAADFWSRWNITLSHWFRDYLFRRLPAGRGGRRLPFNALVTLTVIGLWHGAAWTFVAFGLLQGMAVGVVTWLRLKGVRQLMPYGAALVATLCFNHMTIAFFRGESIDSSLYMLAAVVGLAPAGELGFALAGWLSYLGLAAFYLAWVAAAAPRRLAALPPVPLALLCGLAFALATGFMPAEYQPFIYFQF